MTDVMQECKSCTRKGHAPDNYWPLTDEFWGVLNGKFRLYECKACRNEREAAQPSRQKRKFEAVIKRQLEKYRQARAA